MKLAIGSRSLFFSCLAACFSLSACDKDKDDGSSANKNVSSSKAGKSNKGSSKATPLAKERVKTKEICSEVFSTKSVEEATGLEVDGLEFLVHGKGMCGIGTGSSKYRVGFSIIRVTKSAEDAAYYLGNMTQNKTKEERQNDFEKIANKAAEIDPSTAKPVTQKIKMAMPSVTYSDIAGIGDKARLSKTPFNGSFDYSVWVAVRNVIFTVNVDGKEMEEQARIEANTKLAAAIAASFAGM